MVLGRILNSDIVVGVEFRAVSEQVKDLDAVAMFFEATS